MMNLLLCACFCLAARALGAASIQPTDDSYFYSVDMFNFMKPSDAPPQTSIDSPSKPRQPSLSLGLSGSTEKKLAFVIPVYSTDLCKARLACHNLVQYNNGKVLSLTLMWIDTKEISPEVGEIGKLVKEAGIEFNVFPFSSVVHENMAGWTAQQVAKLRVAELIQSPHYVVLDAKNIPMRPLDLSMFQSDRRTFNFVSCPLEKMNMPHKLWYQETHRTMIMHWDGNTEYGYSVTPFIYHTQTVRTMIKVIELETLQSLEANLRGAKGTEFCFYNVFIRREGLLTDLHDTKNERELNFSHTMWRSSFEKQKMIMEQQETNPSQFFAAHHSWLSGIDSESEKEELRQRMTKLVKITPEMTWFDAKQCFR